MWNEIVNLAIKNGLWAVLFLGLFIFVIRDSTNREKKYQQTIKDLTSHLGIVKEIKEDVDDIKNIVFKNKNFSKNHKKSIKNVQNNTKNQKDVDSISSSIPKTNKKKDKILEKRDER